MQPLSVFLVLLASLSGGGQIHKTPDRILRCTRLSDEPVLRRVQESNAFQAALSAIGNARADGGALSQSDVDRFCESMSPESPPALGGRSLVSFPALPTVELVRALFGVASNEVVLLNPVVSGKLQLGLAETAWKRFVGSRPGLVIAGRPQYIEYACLLYGLLENSFPEHPCDGEEEFSVTAASNGDIIVRLARLRFRVALRPDGSFDRLSV